MSTPLRTTGRLLRAILGLAILLALIAGIPVILLSIGHQPTELAGGWDLLTQQDDGTLFFTVLTTVGWAAWAAFTLSATVEIAATLRGRKARRIKGLGGLQSFASLLIGGLVLLAPTAASAATTGPAVAVTAVQAAGTSTSTAPATSAASEQDTWPTHTVTGESELPWDLAEEYLGKGQRWKDIAALNPSIPQLAAGDQFLPKGAVIRLPADANIATPATPEAEPPTRQTEQTHNQDTQTAPAKAERDTVEPGETLWTIADEHGDPEDWPQIFEANKGTPVPGGVTFTNPDLIVPGQELVIPTATAPADPAPDTRPGPDTETPQKPDAPKDTATPTTPAPAPSTPATPAPATSTPATSTPAEPTSEAPAPAETPPTTSHTTPTPKPTQSVQEKDTAQQGQDSETALTPSGFWLGAEVMAAALIGTLTTRRILQQRRRRPGRRIPMPTGSAAATEQGLRSAQHPSGFDLLDAALRTLALNLGAADRELPVVTAVVLHESRVDLHLDQDTVPMKPFSGTAGRTDLWTCAATNPDIADPDTLQGADAPYPALVSLGWDSAGRLVLVDLEHIGILHLSGDTHHARHVLQAIAVELASTPLPGHLEITALADTAPGLHEAAPERVARTHTLTDAITELTSHATDQRRALAAIGAPTLRTARLRDEAGGAWTPHILLAADVPDGTKTDELFDLMTDAPRVASAVVTSTSDGVAPADGWTISCSGPDETIILPGSGLPIKLQGLTDNHFADAIELLMLSASATDVPASDVWLDDLLKTEQELEEQQENDLEDTPGPEEITEDLEEPSEPSDVVEPTADPDEDGMPAEYADIEREELEHPYTDYTVRPRDPEGTPDRATHLSDPPTSPTSPPQSATSEASQPAPAPQAEPTPSKKATPQAISPPAVPAQLAAAGPVQNAAHSGETGTVPAPAVLLLGPVTINGAEGRIDSNRLSAAVELTSYLALNPGVDHHAIDDALWPGRLVNKQMRNSVISRTRSWLGKNADGDAYFPRVQDTGDSRYRLSHTVTCDWHQFQILARTGLARYDEDGDLALRRALTIVRGRPFAAIDPRRYAWAEPAVQEMVSAITDVAYELSTRRREAADYAGALWAANQGLLAAEENELLHRQVFLAHHGAGDVEALRVAAARLTRINDGLGGGVDMEAETAQLLSTLLPKSVSLR
ncbi:LysM peptidoglycan-binding domain-containing protein [Streptomyces sp. NPDC058128]|uniref:LysM peptidoglycan-binding domain-containing protein n=1 Tax=Streptomyces sp. NPDC058128 TaxID=3346352 RepID=UPI0036E135E3